MRATSCPEQAQTDPSPAPSPWQSSPPTSTSSTTWFVVGSTSATVPLSSLTHTPCSSAASQSGPPGRSSAAIAPLGRGAVAVVVSDGPDVGDAAEEVGAVLVPAIVVAG